MQQARHVFRLRFVEPAVDGERGWNLGDLPLRPLRLDGVAGELVFQATDLPTLCSSLIY